MVKLIRIFPDQLEEIIHDRLLEIVVDGDIVGDTLTNIMEDVEKNETFRPGRR